MTVQNMLNSPEPFGILIGGTGVTSVTIVPAASAWAAWDANKNFSANNFLSGYATTATAASTTTLTVSSAYAQFFTGSTTQTVLLPVTSTLVTGFPFYIVNNSSGNVTIQSSGGNNIQVMAAGTTAYLTCILTTGTTAASWNCEYSFNGGSGSGTVNSSTANNLAYYGSTGTAVSGLATANSKMLITNSSGVPSLGANFVTGTWTPAITASGVNPSSITYSFQIGEYQQIGNIVFYYLRVILSALTLGSANGQLQISSPPITAINQTSNDCIGSALLQTVTFDTGYMWANSRITHNTQLFNIMENKGGTTALAIAITNLNTTSDITLSGFYFSA